MRRSVQDMRAILVFSLLFLHPGLSLSLPGGRRWWWRRRRSGSLQET